MLRKWIRKKSDYEDKWRHGQRRVVGVKLDHVLAGMMLNVWSLRVCTYIVVLVDL